jgi:hypothetical protein
MNLLSFKKSIIYRVVFVFLVTIFFYGCGSESFSGLKSSPDINKDDDNETNQTVAPGNIGKLLDSALAGVSYTSTSKSGTTDANGSFEFADGETTTFKIGNILLGSIESSSIDNDRNVFIPEILGKSRGESNDTSVIKTLQFVQSLDSDGNLSNGIDINSSTSNDLSSVSESNVTDINVTDMITNVLSLSLVAEEKAIAHYESTLSAKNVESSNIFQARLLDSNLSGISYVSDINGTTDSNGTFSYKYGKDVTFKIGGIKLGKINTSDINVTDKLVFIGELLGLPRTNSTDAKLVSLLRLLQSLDSDGNANNGIDINSSISSALASKTSDMSIGISDGALQNIVVTDLNLTLVSINAAIGHYEATLRDNGYNINTLQSITGTLYNKVEGITYNGGDSNGTTDSNGNFDYKSGESITFKVGEITLGSVDISADTNGTVFISDIVGVEDNNSRDTKLVNILRLLYSLDTDNNGSNGITIDASGITAANDYNLSNINDINTTVDGKGKTLISEDEAISYYEEYLRNNGYPTIDTVAPAKPTYIASENNTTLANNVDLNISGEANASIFINGVDTNEDINITTGNTVVQLALNTYSFYDYNITLKDANGNESPIVDYNITRIGIDVNITNPTNNPPNYTDENVTLTLTGDNNASIFYTLDGSGETDTGVDTNSSGGALFTLSLPTEKLYDFQIFTKTNDYNNTSGMFDFNITRVAEVEDPNLTAVIELGYVQDANVTDVVKGYNATYEDANNTYRFSLTPSEEVKAVNGVIKGLDLNSSIELTSDYGSSVISPITTFLEKDYGLLSGMATTLNVSPTPASFSINYIKNSNLNFAQYAQMVWVALNDTNLTTEMINEVKNGQTTLAGFKTVISNKMSGSAFSLQKQYFAKKLVSDVYDYTGTVADMVNVLESK